MSFAAEPLTFGQAGGGDGEVEVEAELLIAYLMSIGPLR